MSTAKLRRAATFLCIILLGTIQILKAQDAKSIVKKMEETMRGASLIVEMEMDVVRPRFQRTIGIKSWALGSDYSMILITTPVRDQGTTYLKRFNEIWNWVPTIERTIKLPPSMMAQSWMGSDFTNDDLVRESSAIEDYTHRQIGDALVQGYDCFVIEMTPLEEAAVVYGKVILYISKEDYLHLKTENYDEEGLLVSTMLGFDIQEMDGRKIPTRIEMIPASKEGHKTVLRYQFLKFNPPLDENFFSIQNMRDLR
jgi:outer membrane lipoprotein-sorting protein